MKSFSATYTPALESAIKAATVAPYPIEVHSGSTDFNAFKDAIGQGIDSHLEAVFFAEAAGEHGRRCFVIEPQTLHVLIRRLMESEDDNAQSLASGICQTLEIELI